MFIVKLFARFEIDQDLKTNKEKIVKGKVISKSDEPKKSEIAGIDTLNKNSSPAFYCITFFFVKVEEGSLFIELQSQLDATNSFELKKGTNNNGVYTFTKNEANIGTVFKKRYFSNFFLYL